jgi:arylsulfatase
VTTDSRPAAEKYAATVPQVFDLLADPQERYDIFMNNYTEHTWTLVTLSEAVKELMKTYVKYPPRKLQSESYSGPITLTQYERFQYVRDMLQKDGFAIPVPTN